MPDGLAELKDDDALKKPKGQSNRYLSDSTETLSPNQVGTLLGVSGEAVKQWIYTRKLAAVRMANGYWRINRFDLQQFLDMREKTALPRLLAFVRDTVWRTIEDAAVKEHYNILRANNYADAILKTSSWKPTILVVDIDHHGEDGWRTLRHKVRAEHLLAVTSEVRDDEVILKLVECGASATLTPNASPVDFLTQCRTLWNGKAQ